jgi:hypothetical protein
MGYFFSLFSLSKAATTTALNCSELSLLLFGIVLVIGLVGEYKTDQHSRRMKLCEMLVIIGVLGELLGDGGVFLFSNQLQVISDNEIREANNKALDAKTSAEGAAGAAARAHAEAGKAQQNVGKVAEQANALATRMVNADSHLSQLEAQASKTKSDLINLAICNAPRVISNWWISGGETKSYVDPLRPMVDQVVFIEVVPDAEARRAALNIARTLDDAHWSVQGPLRFVDGLADGVSVQPFASPHSRSAPESMGKPASYWRAIEVAHQAADKLLDFLHSYNWQAERGWPTDSHLNFVDEKILPIGAIRIQVGLYPPTIYVRPPGEEEPTSLNEWSRREADKAVAEFKRKQREQLAKLPLELRQKVQQMRDEMEAENKMRNARDNGPCQVLNPPF